MGNPYELSPDLPDLCCMEPWTVVRALCALPRTASYTLRAVRGLALSPLGYQPVPLKLVVGKPPQFGIDRLDLLHVLPGLSPVLRVRRSCGLRNLIGIGWKGTRDRRVALKKCGMECGMA